VECSLIEMHHWDYPTINVTDVDDISAYITYYPKWKEKTSAPGAAAALVVQKTIDQVDWF